LAFYLGTAIADVSDVAPWPLIEQPQYSRNEPAYGDAGHRNARTLAMTARSIANFYEYPSDPQVLNPPINLIGYDLGCYDDFYTRHDIYWQNDPATNVPVTHYELWYEQPIGQPYVYGWTSYAPYTPSYVWGATARDRIKACSGPSCSAMSASFYDAAPTCGF